MVHPALMEGLGVSLLQASACRVPIVASRVGGIPEAVQDGLNGLLVEPGNGAALTAAIRRLLGDAALRRQMGEAGRQWVEQAFSTDRLVDDTLQIYHELLR